MDKQPKLIDADKLLYELALQGMMTDDIKRKIDEGEFDPDPIPLPTIKPGDRVHHDRFEANGIVKRISKSGKRAYVIWDRGAPSYVELKSLEVISHD
ncbi:hypothetical protein ACFQ3W_25545 [Paenibacillus puldeungensis]|uniref:DUF4258 domain-containing protein n=1 Tax=Paenibacillus puldeungensis TaxID=696536 RepID=A0ABW3S563_9BACL